MPEETRMDQRVQVFETGRYPPVMDAAEIVGNMGILPMTVGSLKDRGQCGHNTQTNTLKMDTMVQIGIELRASDP
jgi:hypothetical protein